MKKKNKTKNKTKKKPYFQSLSTIGVFTFPIEFILK
uniref:Uncharacterized protein n=1 Tax=Anguilla anguilla TaxID=7936 RepID=A0A0E9RPC8_ANGAN